MNSSNLLRKIKNENKNVLEEKIKKRKEVANLITEKTNTKQCGICLDVFMLDDNTDMCSECEEEVCSECFNKELKLCKDCLHSLECPFCKRLISNIDNLEDHNYCDKCSDNKKDIYCLDCILECSVCGVKGCEGCQIVGAPCEGCDNNYCEKCLNLGNEDNICNGCKNFFCAECLGEDHICYRCTINENWNISSNKDHTIKKHEPEFLLDNAIEKERIKDRVLKDFGELRMKCDPYISFDWLLSNIWSFSHFIPRNEHMEFNDIVFSFQSNNHLYLAEIFTSELFSFAKEEKLEKLLSCCNWNVKFSVELL